MSDIDTRRRRALFMLNTRLAPVFGSHEVAGELRKQALELGCVGPLADVIDLVCQLREPFVCDPVTGRVFLVDADGDELDKQRDHDQNEILGGERVVPEQRLGHGGSLSNDPAVLAAMNEHSAEEAGL